MRFLLYQGKGLVVIPLLLFITTSTMSSVFNINKINSGKSDLEPSTATEGLKFLVTIFNPAKNRNAVVYNWLTLSYMAICTIPMLFLTFIREPRCLSLVTIQFLICHILRTTFGLKSRSNPTEYYARNADKCEMIAIITGFVLIFSCVYRYLCLLRS